MFKPLIWASQRGRSWLAAWTTHCLLPGPQHCMAAASIELPAQLTSLFLLQPCLKPDSPVDPVPIYLFDSSQTLPTILLTSPQEADLSVWGCFLFPLQRCLWSPCLTCDGIPVFGIVVKFGLVARASWKCELGTVLPGMFTRNLHTIHLSLNYLVKLLAETSL